MRYVERLSDIGALFGIAVVAIVLAASSVDAETIRKHYIDSSGE
jgi:hypothetical protein